jgi:cyanophycinase
VSVRLPLALAAVLLVAGPASGQPGALVAIGGGGRPAAVLDTFVALAGRDGARIVVIPWASIEPDSAGAVLARELRAAGAARVDVVPAPDDPRTTALLAATTGIFIAGGDQSRLMRLLGGTRAEASIRRRHAAGVVVGGTSAGAAVMSGVMITGDDTVRSDREPWSVIRAGRVVTTAGLGLVQWAVLDQHFTARRRHNRLLSVVLGRPELLGVGIDEDTAIVVGPDGSFGVLGEGVVSVYDARGVTVTTDQDGDYAASDVRLHVLTSGLRFDPEEGP